NARPLLLEFLHHCRGQFNGDRMARQLICGGEEITLESQRVRINVANHHRIAGCFHKIVGKKKMAGLEIMRDVVESFAFSNSKRNLVNLTLRQLPENLAASYGAVEKIFPSFERSPWMPPRIDFKRDSASHYAVTFQHSSHAAA